MQRIVTTVAVGLAFLAAAHLGVPGGVAGQPEFSPVPVQQRTFPAEVEEASAWRQEGSVGLTGDFEPAFPPVPQVKQSEPGYGSALTPDLPPAPPAPPLPPSPHAISEATLSAAPPVTVVAVDKAAVEKYEVEDNHYVRQFIDRFQTGYRRAVVEAWLTRSGRYLPMILDVFRQKGLPDDLVFTAMVESGFNPVAVSRAGAKGLWQFMAPTARRYGLRVDEWLDERLDPEKSTVAAARHLLDLYAVFGSWNLVQAAYNAGEMKVLQAIRAMGTSDFWTLRSGQVLRDETKNFIPAIQAATVIAREPERYGFVVTPAEPLQYEVTRVPKATDLKLLSARSGIPLDDLERLNLELKTKQTPPDGPYPLKVPVGGARLVQIAIEQHGSMRQAAVSRSPQHHRGKASPTVHVVKQGETIKTIAKRYGISAADVSRWNNLDDTARIRPGDRLRIASAPKRDEGG